MTGQSIQARVMALLPALPGAQRRVAHVVVEDPESVAFGTVQSIAERAETSGPTVVRFAGRLGFDGFAAMQDAVRSEVSTRLQSAASRIQRERQGPLIDQARTVEVANVESTLSGLSDADLAAAVALLADDARRVWVVPSSQLAGIGSLFADNLAICRGRVRLLVGNEFRVHTLMAELRPGDVFVTLDVQRHEAWLVRVQRAAVARGAVPLVITDRLPCSFDVSGGLSVTFACDTVNPFESQVGALALANVLVSGVVDERRPVMTDRVAVLEDLWTSEDLFEG